MEHEIQFYRTAVKHTDCADRKQRVEEFRFVYGKTIICVISGFSGDVNEIFNLLGF